MFTIVAFSTWEHQKQLYVNRLVVPLITSNCKTVVASLSNYYTRSTINNSGMFHKFNASFSFVVTQDAISTDMPSRIFLFGDSLNQLLTAKRFR